MAMQTHQVVKSYVLWNNKGGVGKSTCTFQFATKYAALHPNEEVLVIDLCPQANVSMVFLGGGNKGQLVVEGARIATPVPLQTVFSYLRTLYQRANVDDQTTIDLADYLVRPSDYNAYIPQNLQLMIGDQATNEILGGLYNVSTSVGLTLSQLNRWKLVHLAIRNSIELYTEKSLKPITVFIDTNPSCTVVTEMGICAADRLIIPLKADDSSRMGVRMLLALIWGPPILLLSFAYQADLAKIARPKIFLLIKNQLTQYSGVASAYIGVSNLAAQELWDIYQRAPQPNQPLDRNLFFPKPSCADQNQFESEYFSDLRDFNTPGVIGPHFGIPMYLMTQRNYPIEGQDATPNSKQIAKARGMIEKIVIRL